MSELTPAQRQYMEIKNAHKDSIVFFRMWDFYETFYEDAKICSKVLDIVLTSRSKWAEIPMAGIPYHSSEKYIHKLIKVGYKVAIAEQVSLPKPWEIVQRKVTNIITPWTYLQENFDTSIMAIVQKDDINVAWWDISSWIFSTKNISLEQLPLIISLARPKEIILDMSTSQWDIKNYVKNFSSAMISIFDMPLDSDIFLKSLLQVESLEGYSKAIQKNLKYALSLLLSYIQTNKQKVYVNDIKYTFDEKKVLLDENTINNLEIFSSNWDKKHSLFWVINTSWVNWSKLLSKILVSPTQDENILSSRLDKIDFFIQNPQERKDIIEKISPLWDIEKLLWNIFYKNPSPSLLLKLKNILILLSETDIQSILKDFWFDESVSIQEALSSLSILKNEIENESIDYIIDWIDSELDEMRKIAYHSDEMLLDYQKKLVSETGLAFKIKYILNQWYFLELTKKDSEIFEKTFDIWLLRGQSLKTAQRYTSEYLQSLQAKIFEAKDNLKSIEQNYLVNIHQSIINLTQNLNNLASWVWELDLFSNYANFSIEKSFCRPIFWAKNFEILASRHPVVEKFLPVHTSFVENDLVLDWVHIITGPNMGWKSTYLRQNALVVLLAHCGLFVPAKVAKMPIVDGIFARVGSWDNLSKNQSTFMTEMIEVSNILHSASSKSFVILDELGRGTSTYDWMAIARAVILHLANNIKANVLVASHYHELIELENDFSSIKNYSVAVYETASEVVFLKKIVRWWVSKSYGLEVAKLAWVPKWVISEAKNYLWKLDKNISKSWWLFENSFETNSNTEEKSPVLENLEKIDIDNLTPIQALNELQKLKNML